MTEGTVDYKIVDVDLWEQDAFLEIEGQRIYFQFPQGRTPTLLDALRFLDSETSAAARLRIGEKA